MCSTSWILPTSGNLRTARELLPEPGLIEFRQRLLDDATSACAEMGYTGLQGEYIVALENTPELHNVVVCTQCSCTAWPVLGLPPDWYKSPEYRARVVRQPRRVLSEMGVRAEPRHWCAGVGNQC